MSVSIVILSIGIIALALSLVPWLAMWKIYTLLPKILKALNDAKKELEQIDKFTRATALYCQHKLERE